AGRLLVRSPGKLSRLQILDFFGDLCRDHFEAENRRRHGSRADQDFSAIDHAIRIRHAHLRLVIAPNGSPNLAAAPIGFRRQCPGHPASSTVFLLARNWQTACDGGVRWSASRPWMYRTETSGAGN